jgi:hypothetical protein
LQLSVCAADQRWRAAFQFGEWQMLRFEIGLEIPFLVSLIQNKAQLFVNMERFAAILSYFFDLASLLFLSSSLTPRHR